MTKLIITRGLPGSGKTTMARRWVAEDPADRVRLNRDDLRHSLYGAYAGLTWEQEGAITAAQHSAVAALLDAGKSVIVDDTNLRLRHARAWCDIAAKLGVEFEVRDVLTEATECVERDARRERVVGADVIRKLDQKFSRPWPNVQPSERKADSAPAAYDPKPGKPTCWLVDIDGTVALMDGRSPYDMSRVADDLPNGPVIEVVRRLSERHDIVFLSGRTADARDATAAWLATNVGVTYSGLHMRASGDNRKDFIVKAELFNQHVRDEWHVLGVLDDRTQVVDMWRSIGLTCLQVAEGDF